MKTPPVAAGSEGASTASGTARHQPSGVALVKRGGLADSIAQEVELGAGATPRRTTSIFSMRGLLILNVRSSPTPDAIRRTVMER